MELKTLDTFIEIARQKPKKTIAVAAAEDEPVLLAVKDAIGKDIADVILVGNKSKVESIAEKIGFNIKSSDIINETNPAHAARVCVELIRNNQAHIIMKGLLTTPDYLKAILDKEKGLRSGNLLSHIGFFETQNYPKLIAVTDAAQNIAPDLQEKADIINNSVDLFHRLGVKQPKIAILAAIEGVNPKMQATIDAAALTVMCRRGQLKGCIIDGPLAFDNAISAEAAEHKGIKSEVSGDADLLVAPDIESANILYKSMTFIGGATVAALILGATVPVILTSRSDSERSKLMSIAVAASY
jgi:phosphate butyryltransferase